MTNNHRPEFLASARHERGDTIRLRFGDGREGVVNLADLGLDTCGLHVATVRAASAGTCAELDGQHGETFHIDSSVLRALVDSDYANVLTNPIEPVPNIPMLKALAQINILQHGIAPKRENTSMEILREGREGGMYGIRDDN
jgi:hypothetical protein